MRISYQRRHLIRNSELNEKLVVKGNIKSFYIEGGTEYPLVLRGAKELSESSDFYQLVMRESGGHFGKQVNGEWTTIWEIATKDYVDEIIVGTLTNGAGYRDLIRNESETYYKSIKKNGKVVEFSFVFISKALVADKSYELFRVPYKPKSNLEINIVSKLGKVLSFFCGASGAMVVMPFQAISDGDVIRLHATWICE